MDSGADKNWNGTFPVFPISARKLRYSTGPPGLGSALTSLARTLKLPRAQLPFDSTASPTTSNNALVLGFAKEASSGFSWMILRLLLSISAFASLLLKSSQPLGNSIEKPKNGLLYLLSVTELPSGFVIVLPDVL